MNINGLILKRPSPNSKGMVCLRFDHGGERYPREAIVRLKRNWHFFWFSSWNYSLHEIPYNDLIDLFVVWDDLAAEIGQSGRRDCIAIRGGGETFEPHERLFYPMPQITPDIDLLYIARFIPEKRCDVALRCVQYLAARMPGCRAVFLESMASEPQMRRWVQQQRRESGIAENLRIGAVPLSKVNTFLNRARIVLFTSDREGLCRAVIQALLAERPLLCYRHTSALTRLLYDSRYCHYYDDQDDNSCGKAVLDLLQRGAHNNPGARQYVLQEQRINFHELPGWQAEILAASEPLYAREGQRIDPADIVSVAELGMSVWREFEVME